MVTVRDIAREAGVSISTVSRVLNCHPKVAEHTREQVLKVMEKLGYDKMPRKQRLLAAQKIGIVLPSETAEDIITHPTIYAILSSLTNRLNQIDIRPMVLMVDRSPEKRKVLDELVDAFVLLGTRQEDEDELIPCIQKTGRPVVVVNRWLSNTQISYVNIDDVAASYNMTCHLLKLGHRRVAIANGDMSFRNSQMRLEGYRKAMEKYVGRFDPALELSGAYSEEFGRQAAQAIHGMQDYRPTAVYATSDIIALGLYKEFLKLGYTLPEQMSIGGFGDVEFASYLSPSLTTVRIPTHEIGVQVADMLKTMLSSKIIRYMKVVLEAELVIRESTIKLKLAKE